ncbi:putative transcription factor Ken [Aphomia sociella]
MASSIPTSGYARKCGVTQHIKIVHEGVERPKDKICSYCGRGFKDNKVLQNHIRTHTGERPFVCEVCGAAFAQRVARNMHHKKLHPNTQ